MQQIPLLVHPDSKIAITDEINSTPEQIEESTTKKLMKQNKQNIDLNYISQQLKLLNVAK